MRSRTTMFLLLPALFMVFVYANNVSVAYGPLGARPLLLAHRGLGQSFQQDGLTNETCTASRMLLPEHAFLENTIPSMQAAFSYGADIVELDVQPTTDGHFAVFHDWRLECRTNGRGVTREQTLRYLKTLDVGYGYTADSGKTFPFRGRGVGLMPSLDEVLTAFPGRAFLINIKSNDPREGAMLAARIGQLPVTQQERLMVYGADRPISVIRDRMQSVRAMSRRTLERGLVGYVALGWSGFVPKSCDHTLLLVPADVAPWLWGWPNTFLRRMHAKGTVVVLVGKSRSHVEGFDRIADLEGLPPDYSGGIWTDRIDLIGPALSRPWSTVRANGR